MQPSTPFKQLLMISMLGEPTLLQSGRPVSLLPVTQHSTTSIDVKVGQTHIDGKEGTDRDSIRARCKGMYIQNQRSKDEMVWVDLEQSLLQVFGCIGGSFDRRRPTGRVL